MGKYKFLNLGWGLIMEWNRLLTKLQRLKIFPADLAVRLGIINVHAVILSVWSYRIWNRSKILH